MKLINDTHGGTGVGQFFQPLEDLDFIQGGMLDISDSLAQAILQNNSSTTITFGTYSYVLNKNGCTISTVAGNTVISKGFVYTETISFGSLPSRSVCVYSPQITLTGVVSPSAIYGHLINVSTADGAGYLFADGSTAIIHNDLQIFWDTNPTYAGEIASLGVYTGFQLFYPLAFDIIASPTWINITPGSNWTSSSAPYHLKCCIDIFGVVRLSGSAGAIASGTGAYQVLCTLPVGYRPVVGDIVIPSIYDSVTSGFATPVAMRITTGGQVIVVYTGTVTAGDGAIIDNISFPTF